MSRIGAESNKFIRNNALYQIYSILIKSPLAQTTWIELYKKFVHPAGIYIAGSVQTDVEAVGTLSAPLASPDSGNPGVISSAVTSAIAPFTQMTILSEGLSIDSGGFRSQLGQTIDKYQSIPANELNTIYGNINEILTVKSFTFDDSDIGDSAGTARPDFSIALETIDNEQFDSSFNS